MPIKIYANLDLNRFIRFRSIAFTTDKRTNKRTNGRTNKQVDNIMPLASLDWCTDKKNICTFADGIAFVCFYDDERVLSAIAKFLGHVLGKWRGVVKWERGR